MHVNRTTQSSMMASRGQTEPSFEYSEDEEMEVVHDADAGLHSASERTSSFDSHDEDFLEPPADAERVTEADDAGNVRARTF